jgi:MYXO-CTERM domain-containing protein
MLTVTNAVDPQGAALTYDFQIFSDVGLTILVAEDANIAEGAGGTTSWAVPVNLVENTTYYWRVRTRDSFTNGAYSAVCSFLVNSVNETPGVPRINAPAFGSQVNSLTPALVVDNATDPDLDTLTYEFEVYGDQALSTHIAAVTGVVSGATTSTWTVDVALAEDTTYYWRARATDDGALSGDWSSVGQFFVTTMNAPPEIPVMMTPQNGTVVADVRPELMILNADDADFDVLVYDWELATDDTFANVVDSADDASAQGAQNTAFALAADLTEDTRYCWRVRSDDGAATSAYATACFFVSTTNDAPSVPTLQNPSADSSVTTVSPVFSWAPSTDPEGEALVYDVEILDAAGDLVTSIEGVTGTTTAMAEQLEDGETYTWHARSRDNGGVASEFSAENQFVVDLPDAPVDEPEVVVNGGGCSTTGGSGAGGLLLVGLGLMVARRRRRG